MALAGRVGHHPVCLREHCTLVEGGFDRKLWDLFEDDNLALVSDDSECCPASSMVGVARMVAGRLSLDERLTFQQVSLIISLLLKMELGRGVWNSLEADT